MPTYSTLEKLQLLSAFQDSTESLTVFADYHRLRPRTLATWIHQFLTAGLAGIWRPSRNQSYSTELKFQAVHDYRQGMSPKELLVKYQIRNVSQLYQWKVQYNNGELFKTNSPRRMKRKMGRKVSYEEKVAITKWVLAHQNDYAGASQKFNVSYSRVYSWVKKSDFGQDWSALHDHRGKTRNQPKAGPETEVDKLRREIKELKAKNREMEVQIAFAKKLTEIRNRGGAITGRNQAIQEMTSATASPRYSVMEATKPAGISRQAYYSGLTVRKQGVRFKMKSYWP